MAAQLNPALPTIGEQIRRLRLQRTPKMTQREVAERAGVSVDLIKKLETGVKQTALLVSLHKIARALDVDVAMLLARPEPVEVADDNDGGVVAIRLAITAVRSDTEPAGLEELTQQARYAWNAYWTSHLDVLAGLLPGFIAVARATAREHPTPQTYAVLSDAYGIAASLLVHLGYTDLAYLAMERAIAAADHSDDELRHAALSGWMSWLLMHQTGSAAQAQHLAVSEADSIEPRFAKAPPKHIAVWGGLLLSGAIAAARDDRPDEADDMLNLAESAATRLQVADREVRMDHERPFGAPVVIQVSVDAAVVTGRPGRALEIAKRMPPDADLPPAGKARHLTDVAFAQTGLGRDREATETLLRVEREAPHWMRYQPYPRLIVRELLERERRARTPRLRELAARLKVA